MNAPRILSVAGSGPIKRLGIALILFIAVHASLAAGGTEEETVSTTPARAEATTAEDAADGGVPIELTIREGEHFEHKLKIMPLVRVKNHPQMAVWCETTEGEFIATLFITESIATQSWRSAPGDSTPKEEIRRVESLPAWSHRHGNVYADGAPLPTDEEPMPDAVTAATPTTGFRIETRLPPGDGSVVVYVEVNNSADFNDAYPKDAVVGTPGYSGGPWGSGQPALVYAAEVDRARLASGSPTTLECIGHSSPDGSSGEINRDLTGVTTAAQILDEVEIGPRSSR